jgi:hypothetical protein
LVNGAAKLVLLQFKEEMWTFDGGKRAHVTKMTIAFATAPISFCILAQLYYNDIRLLLISISRPFTVLNLKFCEKFGNCSEDKS